MSAKLPEIPCLPLKGSAPIPMFGCGVWELSPDETLKVLEQAIGMGYRLIDTAQYYGNEAAVGEAVRRSGVPRSEFYLISKLDPAHARPDAMRAALERTAAAFDQNLDLMLIHWPFPEDTAAWRLFEDYHSQGIFKALGVSNYSPDRLKKFLNSTRVPPVLNQIEYHPYNAKPAAVKANRDLGLAVQAWSPLADRHFALLDDPVIQRIASQCERTPAQVVLRWDLQHQVITIPRSRNPQHLRENLGCLSFELSHRQMAEIDALDREAVIWNI